LIEVVCGCDPREQIGLAVFQSSVHRYASETVAFTALVEGLLRKEKLYSRPHEIRDGRLWCPISDAPMSTAFANSRFITPWLASRQWVLFADAADMLALDDLAKVFAMADERYAIMCVQHRYEPTAETKMDDQIQTRYSRKNWSSFVLWNTFHHGNRRLTLKDVNERPGRDLHRFFWLRDDEIGALPTRWNSLVGVCDDPAPGLLHFTECSPELGYRGPFANAWLAERARLEGQG
jgi:hypothetical protein